MQVNPIDVEVECNKWETTLMGYIIGDTPPFKDMLKFVYGGWNFVTTPQVYLHDEGYFTFQKLGERFSS